jgi:vitamin B12 transporter
LGNYYFIMKFSGTRSNKKDLFSFKAWGRKRYSLFVVIKKVVKICVLPVTYFLSLPVISVAVESDSSMIRIDLEEIEVSASGAPAVLMEKTRVLHIIGKRDIERLPAGSVQDILKYLASVDVRQRGAEGVQADISIRGGSFDQTLILLNGINITDPQTGHHNLNLPVSLSQIERIEVLEGPAARIYGPNAFSGAINIVTRDPSGKGLSAQLEGGSYGFFNSGASGSLSAGKTNHLFAGSRSCSKGYIKNTDFKISTLFYSGNLLSEKGKFLVQAGASGKGFGANSFYTPKYPNQYERTQTLFLSAKWVSSSKYHLTPAIYGRRHFDTFMLFRDNAPEWYGNHNFHRTDVWGAALSSWFLREGGKTSLGTEFRSENILSNVLGEILNVPVRVPKEDIFYTHAKTRNTASFYFEHVWYLNRFICNAGAMANHISGGKGDWNFFPGISLSYQVSPPVTMVASWNNSLRMPTFTDLYYSGPTNTGNPDLKPEKSETLEGGFKFRTRRIQGHLMVFSRSGKNTIDWIKSPGEEKWKSMNHAEMHSKGAIIGLQADPLKKRNTKWPVRLQVSYLFNKLNKKGTSYISYYILDNLRHKLTASISQTLPGNLSAGIVIVFQDREGSYTSFKNGWPQVEVPYHPFWLADAKVSYRHQMFQFFITAKNLFNREYFDLGNVPQPGRWMKAGISINAPGLSRKN